MSSIKIQKELKSFIKQVGKHGIWFESLPKRKQLDLLMGWKSIKFYSKKQNTSPSLKKFISENRLRYRYKVPIHILRQKTLEKLLS